MNTEDIRYLNYVKWKMTVKREIDFPNAIIKIYNDGHCYEFSKVYLCCDAILRSRNYVAKAVKQLRQNRRNNQWNCEVEHEQT